ncbi:5-formyltetrahydrofolate cyclo-ligase [Streptococcus loxodontisalivarius]|uniref:5-formyltetrahydrofolate cyclo-ligase n=1 Tax=Streptococcus loxodontisalivarius TaxID=1349415 RepID=A0ABS2PS52_9STRE|nr:5-formyltetrahydrofolate cyclo-ligase [Streptococcus loxodontisalivarius]MBM7642864.1 5-formyltetrahydrofolate cyclo-ligase [Streptococcus loxodontisalivarius]
MLKKELRQAVISALKEQDKTDKERLDRELLATFIESEAYQEAKTIATYLSMGFEYNTAPLIEQALKDGKRVLVPKTYPKGRMVFVAYDPEDLVKTSFGLLEPASDIAVAKEDIDLIHTPGVVFNKEGYRIGYGAGYYDRYLADFKGNTMSLVYPCQLKEFTPDSHDIPVKEVLISAGI